MISTDRSFDIDVLMVDHLFLVEKLESDARGTTGFPDDLSNQLVQLFYYHLNYGHWRKRRCFRDAVG